MLYYDYATSAVSNHPKPGSVPILRYTFDGGLIKVYYSDTFQSFIRRPWKTVNNIDFAVKIYFPKIPGLFYTHGINSYIVDGMQSPAQYLKRLDSIPEEMSLGNLSEETIKFYERQYSNGL